MLRVWALCEAKQIVKARLKAENKKPSHYAQREISLMAQAYLAEGHWAELEAQSLREDKWVARGFGPSMKPLARSTNGRWPGGERTPNPTICDLDQFDCWETVAVEGAEMGARI